MISLIFSILSLIFLSDLVHLLILSLRGTLSFYFLLLLYRYLLLLFLLLDTLRLFSRDTRFIFSIRVWYFMILRDYFSGISTLNRNFFTAFSKRVFDDIVAWVESFSWKGYSNTGCLGAGRYFIRLPLLSGCSLLSSSFLITLPLSFYRSRPSCSLFSFSIFSNHFFLLPNLITSLPTPFLPILLSWSIPVFDSLLLFPANVDELAVPANW